MKAVHEEMTKLDNDGLTYTVVIVTQSGQVFDAPVTEHSENHIVRDSGEGTFFVNLSRVETVLIRNS